MTQSGDMLGCREQWRRCARAMCASALAALPSCLCSHPSGFCSPGGPTTPLSSSFPSPPYKNTFGKNKAPPHAHTNGPGLSQLLLGAKPWPSRSNGSTMWRKNRALGESLACLVFLVTLVDAYRCKYVSQVFCS